ncbi:MAG: toll/interleukin-1 receptor domain-containing protein [Pseudomonadota bacterium]
MADVFISYKREDQEEHGRVSPIAEALRAEGYEVFYDVQIPPGSSWEEVLEQKIAAAKCVLVLWSQHSVDSDWVKEEADLAKTAGKLIPVFIDQVRPPLGFARIEGADLSTWTGSLDHPEWRNLVAAVKARIGQGGGAVDPTVRSVAVSKRVQASKSAGRGHGGGRGAMSAVLAVALLAAGGAGAYWYTQIRDPGVVSPGNAPMEPDPYTDRNDTPTTDIVGEAWESTKRTNTITAYGDFALRFSSSGYRSEADTRALGLARQAGTISAYEEYLRFFPTGSGAADLKRRLDTMRASAEADNAWNTVRRANEIEVYARFAAQFPDSPRRADADRAAFNIAAGQGTRGWYSRYLDAFPEGDYAARARAAISEMAEAEARAQQPNYADIPNQSFRANGVTIRNVRPSPAPPYTLSQNQQVTVGFDYSVCCGKTVRVWVRPVTEGPGGCRYGASGSPAFEGSGSSSSNFNMSGGDCARSTITGLRFNVADDQNRDDAEDFIIPVAYDFR